MHLSCEDQEEDWVLCVKPRPRAYRFKIVSWLSITSDIPDSPRAPFQVHSHGHCGDAYFGPIIRCTSVNREGLIKVKQPRAMNDLRDFANQWDRNLKE